MNRYKVIEGSPSGHACCFEATVVDTTQPAYPGCEPGHFLAVCECFETKDAEMICAALNSGLDAS